MFVPKGNRKGSSTIYIGLIYEAIPVDSAGMCAST